MELNGVAITSETILATRKHFADLYKSCIKDVETGRVRVNNVAEYIAYEESRMTKMIAGESDNTLTFLQRAFWIQTGEMVAILK